MQTSRQLNAMLPFSVMNLAMQDMNYRDGVRAAILQGIETLTIPVGWKLTVNGSSATVADPRGRKSSKLMFSDRLMIHEDVAIGKFDFKSKKHTVKDVTHGLSLLQGFMNHHAVN